MAIHAEAPVSDLERRKSVRLRRRPDLGITPQKYEGKTFYVVKDPVSLRYYRFKEQEHYLLNIMDGKHTLDDAQKDFEKRFRPERLTLEDLEQFGQQLLQAGLVQNETPGAGKLLFEHRQKRIRMEWLGTLTNILYIKIPVFDPEKLLNLMLPWLSWMFTLWFLFVSVAFLGAAVWLVMTHFDTFYSKLPSYQEFFNFKSIFYLWIALGAVKIIHEFGHGLSCKAFKGEVHEMGFLLLCLSPAMYCNVSDAWTLPNKWHRIIISAAGIYVELMIAAMATFTWWNTPGGTFVNNLSLSLMIVCSVSTVLFNGNPLMRYDGYYVLADWLEIPNLRDRANRFLQNLAMEYCLGIEVQPEPYMELWRKVLFVVFAVVSYVYRWVVTFVILKFMATFLKPYKLEVISSMLAAGALASMIGWPLYRLIKNVRKRGRFPDMKPARVSASAVAVAVVLLGVFFLPLPISRVSETGLVQIQPMFLTQRHAEVPGRLVKLPVKEGQRVRKDQILAEFQSQDLDVERVKLSAEIEAQEKVVQEYKQAIGQETEHSRKADLENRRNKATSDLRFAKSKLEQVNDEMSRLILRAPRDGIVIGVPLPEEIGKMWTWSRGVEKDRDDAARNQDTLFCKIGDPAHLRVIVPVPAADMQIMHEDMARAPGKGLAVTIRVVGRGMTTWTGRVMNLPPSETISLDKFPELSSKFGGPVPVKPASDSKLVPQSQVFLVDVDFDAPDRAIAVNSLAQVHIHCEWRSIAWFVWRKVSSTFDLPLM
jgi:putative peptide zinc metalloprotease protein